MVKIEIKTPGLPGYFTFIKITPCILNVIQYSRENENKYR